MIREKSLKESGPGLDQTQILRLQNYKKAFDTQKEKKKLKKIYTKASNQVKQDSYI